MNVATSQSAVIAGSSDVTQSSSKTSNNTKTSDKSFDEEMKSASKTEETSKDTKETKETKETEKAQKNAKNDSKNSKNDSNVSTHELDNDIITQEMLNVNFTDFKYHNESQSILSQNIQSLLDTKDIMNLVGSAQVVEYDAINMSDADAEFFANLVQSTDKSGIMNEISNQLIENSQNVQKSIQVSSVLMEKLAESLRNNKPFRIDFDKDISVIIKVNKDGSLAANFIPGDKAVEQYLRNNIESLRQRFDEENLSYSQLSYSNSRNGQQQKQKKENDNE